MKTKMNREKTLIQIIKTTTITLNTYECKFAIIIYIITYEVDRYDGIFLCFYL